MSSSINTSTAKTSQSTQTQEIAAPKQKEIDRKSTVVGHDKMYRAKENVANTAIAAGRASVGFFKGVANKVGLVKDRAADTIGQNTTATETRASKAEARKSQNTFISFLDKNAKFNEVMDDQKSTPVDKQNAFLELKGAYSKLSPRDQEIYKSELDQALSQFEQALTAVDKSVNIKNASRVDHIMKEILSTEKSFLTNIQNILQGLEKLEKDPKVPKNELARMKGEYKSLEMEVSKNVKAMESLVNSSISVAQKMLLLKEHISLNKDSSYGKAMEKAVLNFQKNTSIIDNSGDPKNKNMLNQNLITPIQRGPRYGLFVADLSRHSGPASQALANDLQAEINSNVARLNEALPK